MLQLVLTSWRPIDRTSPTTPCSARDPGGGAWHIWTGFHSDRLQYPSRFVNIVVIFIGPPPAPVLCTCTNPLPIALTYNDAAASIAPANLNVFLLVTTTSTGYFHSMNLAQPEEHRRSVLNCACAVH